MQNGRRDATAETELAELDDLLARLWPRLVNDFVDLGNAPVRQGISLFMATLFLRHPYRLARQQDTRRRLVGFIEGVPKDGNGLPDIEWLGIGKERFAFDRSAWPVYKEAGAEYDHRTFVDMIRSEAGPLAEELMRKRWSVLFIDEPLFITSDNPFFVMDPDLKRDQVLGRGAKLMFPMSPTRILCFDDLDEPANQYYKVPLAHAATYNMFTWVNTDDFLVSPRNVDDVLKEIDDAGRHWEEQMRSEAKSRGFT